jgi:hypothetical protein
MPKPNAQRQAEWRDRQKAAKQAMQQAAGVGRAAVAEPEPEDRPNRMEAPGETPDGEAVPEQPRADVIAIGAEVLKRLKRYSWALEAIVASGSLADARALARRALGLPEPTVAAPAQAPAVPTPAGAPAAQEHCSRCGGTRFYVLNGERHCSVCMPAGVPRGYWASHPAEEPA